MLIDCHVHLNNYHEGSGIPRQAQVQELWAKMAERGVDHAVVLTSYKVTPDRPSVEEVLEMLAGDPRATVVEGLRWKAKEKKEKTDLYAMEERIRDGIVRGIKLYPGYEPYAINDPSLEAVFSLAAKHDVPVMVHTGDTYAKHAKIRHAHPLLLDDVAVDYPDVTFVMCHAGNPWLIDAAQVLYKNDNVVADISGLTLGAFEADFERFMLQRVKDMIRYLGAADRQLMYGSDWPLVSMGAYVDFMERLELTPEQKEWLAWRTAAEVFKIDTAALGGAAANAAATKGRDRPED